MKKKKYAWSKPNHHQQRTQTTTPPLKKKKRPTGQTKPSSAEDLDSSTTDEEGETNKTQTTVSPSKKTKYRLIEDLSLNAITTEGDSTTLPIRHCQQVEEVRTWTSVPLLQHISSSDE